MHPMSFQACEKLRITAVYFPRPFYQNNHPKFFGKVILLQIFLLEKVQFMQVRLPRLPRDAMNPIYITCSNIFTPLNHACQCVKIPKRIQTLQCQLTQSGISFLLWTNTVYWSSDTFHFFSLHFKNQRLPSSFLVFFEASPQLWHKMKQMQPFQG